MANAKVPTSPTSTSPQEQFQHGSPGISSPKTSADQSIVYEVHGSSTADTSRGSKKLDVPNQEEQHYRLYTTLRAIVNDVSAQLRRSSDEVLDPDPISYCLPQNYDAAQSNQSFSAEAKTRGRSTLVGEEIVSFVLPPDCKIAIESSKNVQHQSSFEERLRGWQIECRRRANGKLDMIYRHRRTRRMFRSTIEVVEFIMEAFVVQEQSAATAAKGLLKRKISSSKKEETPPSKLFEITGAGMFPSAQSETSRSGDTSIEKANPETNVKLFLEEPYNNLMNFSHGGAGTQESEHDRKASLKSSSENKNDTSSDEETRMTGEFA